MDRYSTGSLIYKKGIDDVFEVKNEIKIKNTIINNKTKSDKPIKSENKKANISLKDVDDKMMTIDDFLDDFDI